MTKAQAKRFLKDTFDLVNEVSTAPEKIVDMDVYLDETDNSWMFRIITVSKNHVPYQYAGWIEDGEIHYIKESCGLLTVVK